MGTTGRKLRNSAETAPRAAALHFSGDLDRQARLAVEGVFLHSRQKHSMGHSSGFGGNLIDPETIQCTRWVTSMEQVRASHE
jgi:hypothetical protein